LGKFLKQNHRPAKLSYSFFLNVARKFGRIENSASPKAQGALKGSPQIWLPQIFVLATPLYFLLRSAGDGSTKLSIF